MSTSTVSVESSPIPHEPASLPEPAKKQRKARAFWALIITALVFAMAVGIYLALHWPYSENMLTAGLQDTFKTRVSIHRFLRFYFPHPGCAVEFLTLSGADGKALASVEKMTITGRYSDLIFRPYHLADIRLDGLKVQIPSVNDQKGFWNSETMNGSDVSKVSIGSVTAEGAELEFETENPTEPLNFEIHKLRVDSIAAERPMNYQVSMSIPEPPGELESKGTLGPLRREIAKIPVKGSAAMRNARLDKYPGIGGTLRSDDIFSGTLEQVQVSGNADIPDFHLKRPSHNVHVTSQFQVTVDATEGEARLRTVAAKIGQSNLHVQGSVAKNAKLGRRETTLDFTMARGRAEDLLWLFSSAAKPAMQGPTMCNGQVQVAKFGAGFLNSLRMNGRFEVTDGHFQREMQVKANELSARAQGKKVDNPAEAAEVAITSLSADVAIENGTAHLSRLYFEVPGARARVQGTYALEEHQVDLHGNLWTDATVSKDTTGIVSVLLKPIDPLFKRKHAGAMVEVEMNGKIEQPHFGVELTKQKTAWKGAP
jgi:hypothetical protein